MCVQFHTFKNFQKKKILKKLKKKVRFLKKKVLAPILIPEFDIGFGSRHRNLVLVAHYLTETTIWLEKENAASVLINFYSRVLDSS